MAGATDRRAFLRILGLGGSAALLAACAPAAPAPAPAATALPPTAAPPTSVPTAAPKPTSAPAPATQAPTAAVKPTSATAPAPTTGATPATVGSITIGMPSPNGQLVNIFIARDKGFYKNHGLEVSLVTAQGGTTSAAALIAGQVQLVESGGPEALSAAAAGADIIVVGDVIPYVQFKIFGQKGGVTTPEQLKGKRFGVSKFGASTDFAARAMFKKWGIDPNKDLTMLQIGATPDIFAALQGGSIDAGIFSDPSSALAELQGYPVIADLNKEKIRYPSVVVTSTRKVTQEQPEQLRAALAALFDGMKYLKANQEDAATIMMSALKIDNREVAVKSVQGVAEGYVDDMTPQISTYKDAIPDLVAADPRVATVDLEKFIVPGFTPKP